MNSDQLKTEEQPLGERLLGMQGFSAERAKRYRSELEQILVHRITAFERWTLGIFGVFLGLSFSFGGVFLMLSKPRAPWTDFDEARLTFAATGIATGVILGGWLLSIAVMGGYGRRLGDLVGPFITLVLCGGWGFAFMSMAWHTSDAVMRTQLLLVGVTLFVVMAVSILLAHFQRMHRQTKEQLLRIEFHVAQLLERSEMSAT